MKSSISELSVTVLNKTKMYYKFSTTIIKGKTATRVI